MSTLLKAPGLRLDLSRRVMPVSAEDDEQRKAATQLQSTYRGKLSRKERSVPKLHGAKPSLTRGASSSSSPMGASVTTSQRGSTTHRTPPPMKRANTTSRRLSFDADSEGGLLEPAPGPAAAVLDRGIFQRLRTACELPREVPVHPESLKLELAKRKIFTKPEDQLVCSQLYEDLFDETCHQKELVLTGLTMQWTAAALRNFVRVLPEFKRCILLDLTDTVRFGNSGCKAICDVLRLGDDGMASLVELRLQRCGILNQGALELARALPEASETLTSVDMNGNLLGSTALFKLQESGQKRRGLVIKCASKSSLQDDDDGPRRSAGSRNLDGKMEKQQLTSGAVQRSSGNDIIAKLLG